jgi:hypothetical protein
MNNDLTKELAEALMKCLNFIEGLKYVDYHYEGTAGWD